MNNREWLEDKKNQLKNATVFVNENGNEAVEVSLTVLNRLFEQAERAEYNNIWSERVRKYKEQNERYREYLGRLQRASKRYPTEDLPHVINKITSEALEDTQ